jgi:hypothetical protein
MERQLTEESEYHGHMIFRDALSIPEGDLYSSFGGEFNGMYPRASPGPCFAASREE